MLALDHLSYSSINTYLMCPAYWKFHYIDQLPTKPSTSLVFGGAFHTTIEKYLMGEKDITKAWNTSLDDKLSKEKDINWEEETPDSLRQEGTRLFSHPSIVEGLQSISVGKDEDGFLIERRIEMHVPEIPLPIIGYIDMIGSDGIPGDFKTDKSSWSEDRAQLEIQPLFYLAGLHQAGKRAEGKFRHYIFVKTKTPKFQLIEHAHTDSEIQWAMTFAQGIWKGMNGGVFHENPNSWKCTPKYCEYWMLCRGK
jgi:hypothetical protein